MRLCHELMFQGLWSKETHPRYLHSLLFLQFVLCDIHTIEFRSVSWKIFLSVFWIIKVVLHHKDYFENISVGISNHKPHLRDFPTSEWLLHFSDVIGASHSADYRVWQKGGIASKGLEQVEVDIDNNDNDKMVEGGISSKGLEEVKFEIDDDGDDNDKEGDDDGAQ